MAKRAFEILFVLFTVNRKTESSSIRKNAIFPKLLMSSSLFSNYSMYLNHQQNVIYNLEIITSFFIG